MEGELPEISLNFSWLESLFMGFTLCQNTGQQALKADFQLQSLYLSELPSISFQS